MQYARVISAVTYKKVFPRDETFFLIFIEIVHLKNRLNEIFNASYFIDGNEVFKYFWIYA